MRELRVDQRVQLGGGGVSPRIKILIAIPKPVREQLGLERGADVAIRVEGEELILRKVSRGSWRGWEGRYKGSRLLQDLAEERTRERRRDAEGSG